MEQTALIEPTRTKDQNLWQNFLESRDDINVTDFQKKNVKILRFYKKALRSDLE